MSTGRVCVREFLQKPVSDPKDRWPWPGLFLDVPKDKPCPPDAETLNYKVP